MRIGTGLLFWAAMLLPCTCVWADGPGLSADASLVPWPALHGRIAYAAVTDWRSDLSLSATGGLKANPVSVMGDLYFSSSTIPDKGQAGGFRATSGIVVGARNTLWSSPGAAPASGLLSVSRHLFGQGPAPSTGLVDASADAATLPYIGVGYSNLAMRSGWSFSADLGLVSLNPGSAVRLGRVFTGGQGVDDVVHDLRLSPVLQFGVSYSF